jgi:hypothetical protein
MNQSISSKNVTQRALDSHGIYSMIIDDNEKIDQNIKLKQKRE